MKIEIPALLLALLLSLFPTDSRGGEPNLAEIYKLHAVFKDDTGKNQELRNFLGKRVILTMSYTQCRKICPMVTFEKLKEIQKAFAKNKIQAEFVIVTLDPKNDTPDVLNRFRKRRELNYPNWHFLTGSEEGTEKLSQLLQLDVLKEGEHLLHGFKIFDLDQNGRNTHELNWENRDVSSLLGASH